MAGITPLEEGQANTPKNRCHRDEVHPTPDRLSFDPTTSPPADKIGLNPMPSPLGRVPFRVEGQTDTPINPHHLEPVMNFGDW